MCGQTHCFKQQYKRICVFVCVDLQFLKRCTPRCVYSVSSSPWLDWDFSRASITASSGESESSEQEDHDSPHTEWGEIDLLESFLPRHSHRLRCTCPLVLQDWSDSRRCDRCNADLKGLDKLHINRKHKWFSHSRWFNKLTMVLLTAVITFIIKYKSYYKIYFIKSLKLWTLYKTVFMLFIAINL